VDRLPEGVEGHVEEGELNPDIISVRNGVMNMRLHTENGAPQVAAPEPKINGNNELNQLYGRYEMRFRADPVSGYKLAWLLWPKSEIWPRDGEIDAPEGNLTGTISAFMHRQGAAAGSDQAKFSTTAGFNDWHVLAYEWTPTRFEVFLDTKSIGCATARILNTPMRWVLQSETELNKTYPAQNAVANVQCDYVKAWRYTGKAA
jgi:beta-glucanase (GH16 family)